MRPIALLLVVAVLAAGCDRQKADERQAGALGWSGPGEAADGEGVGRLVRDFAGTPIPAVAIRDPDGEPANLAEMAGRPILLNLWATWCAPCIIELPELDTLAADAAAPLVLTVSQDLGDQQPVRDFLAERGVDRLDAWHDPDMALSSALKVNTLPTTILYDSNGREVWRVIGREAWAGRRAASLLAEAR